MMEPELKAGRHCFYFESAIAQYGMHIEFNRFIHVVVARFRENGKTNGRFKYQLREDNGNLINVPAEHVIPVRALSKKDREKILRLCRLIGYLKNRHPNGFVLNNITAKDILNFEHGKGKIFDFLGLRESDQLAGQAKGYVNGNIRSLNGIIFEGKLAKASTLLKRPISGIPKLPVLETIEDAQRFAEQIFQKAKTQVYGQDHALRLLIVRLISYIKTGEAEPLLLAGPTGVGKTLSVATVSGVMQLPFGRVAIPELTPAGYVGANLENALAEEIRSIKRMHKDPQRVVIQIDEFDKIVRKGPEFAAMLQDQILKFLEPGSELIVGTKHDNRVEKIDINLFLVLSGAFSFIKYDHLEGLGEENLTEGGFTDELIGRMGNAIVLRAFNEDDFRHLLTADPPLKVVTRSTADLSSFGIKVILESDTIELLAKLAVKSRRGARKLSSDVRDIIDGLKKDLLFGGESINGKNDQMEGVTIEKLAEGRRAFRIRREFAERYVKPQPAAKRIGFG